MENSNEKIKKYNVSEKDLYILGIIEAKKSTAGLFEKEKLKAKSMGVLKPYNIKFMDIGTLLDEIKKQDYHKDQILIEKYGIIDLETTKSSMGLKYSVPIIGIIAVIFYFTFMSGVSACDCANLYENTPLDKKHSFEDYDNGNVQSEVNDFVEKQRQCAIKFGNLTKDEEYLAKTANSGMWIPKLGEAVENAKKECKK
jgi:hypothetical protein